MNDNQELLKGLREGLEAGLTKEAGVSELSEEQRQFVDMTMENFEKLASETPGFFSGMREAFGGKEVGQAVLKAGVPLLGGLGVAAAAKAVSSISNGMNRNKFENSLRMAISRNAVLQHADQERVKSLADSIYATAPNVSTDPNILGQVLVNAIRGENLDIQTVKMLAELESRRTQGSPLTARNFSL
jgi:hypothetical protein